ncbi:hypothetical protein SESBI_15475 [Sesbania bispinosa]|nr:hypothetical protein SESBI_15475 [Sesbania bispinosa]
MATTARDPIEDLISDGRVSIRPYKHYGLLEVITVDLDDMATALQARLVSIFTTENRLCNCYVGTITQITDTINTDTTALVNYAIGQTYNRLRSVLERTHPTAKQERMKPRFTDGPLDALFVFATTSATMKSYGRDHKPEFNFGRYERIMSALRSINVRMAPFDFTGTQTVSYFPFLDPAIDRNNVWIIYGLIHPSHYENEDVPCSMLNALAALPPKRADQRVRPVAGIYRVNFHGIQPAVAASGSTMVQRRGMYVYGRGTYLRYSCVLANTEITQLIRYCVFGS